MESLQKYALPTQKICLIQVFLKHIHVGGVDQVVWQCEFAQRVWQACSVSFPS